MTVHPRTPLSQADLDSVYSIYGQDLFQGEPAASIASEIDGFHTTIYTDEEGKVVGVSSVDMAYAHLGEAVLEFLAVDSSQQGMGFGREIIDHLKQECREYAGSGEATLFVNGLTGRKSYYVDIGAIEADDGTLYFDLDEA